MNQNASMQQHTVHARFLSRELDAPRDLVWRAWTEAERWAKWWGPKVATKRVEHLDFQPGGTLHYTLQAAQGPQMWGKFVYREIAPPERLIFVMSFADSQGNTIRAPFSPTHPLGMLVDVTFSEQNDRTTITIRGSVWNATEEDSQSFNAALENLTQHMNVMIGQLGDYLATIRA